MTIKRSLSLSVLALTAVAGFALAGCSSHTTSTPTQSNMIRPVGHDHDAHGCIGSAGYVWSSVTEQCVRPFEAGIKLNPTQGNKNYSAFVLFDKQSKTAELFMVYPHAPSPVHLVQQKNKTLWKNTQFTLKKSAKGLQLYSGKSLIFQETHK